MINDKQKCLVSFVVSFKEKELINKYRALDGRTVKGFIFKAIQMYVNKIDNDIALKKIGVY